MRSGKMKRSELIDKVLLDLADIVINSPKFTNRCTDRDALELVLDLFESYGMLPPYNPIGSERDDGAVQSCQFTPEEDPDDDASKYCGAV
jgi:hypothetical protein